MWQRFTKVHETCVLVPFLEGHLEFLSASAKYYLSCLSMCVPQELILFSRADLERSIPNMVDGLKPGQRKILFCCFKRNFKKDVKVRSIMTVQLSLYLKDSHAG